MGSHGGAEAGDFVHAFVYPVFRVDLSRFQQPGHGKAAHGLAERVWVARSERIVAGNVQNADFRVVNPVLHHVLQVLPYAGVVYHVRFNHQGGDRRGVHIWHAVFGQVCPFRVKDGLPVIVMQDVLDFRHRRRDQFVYLFVGKVIALQELVICRMHVFQAFLGSFRDGEGVMVFPAVSHIILHGIIGVPQFQHGRGQYKLDPVKRPHDAPCVRDGRDVVLAGELLEIDREDAALAEGVADDTAGKEVVFSDFPAPTPHQLWHREPVPVAVNQLDFLVLYIFHEWLCPSVVIEFNHVRLETRDTVLDDEDALRP